MRTLRRLLQILLLGPLVTDGSCPDEVPQTNLTSGFIHHPTRGDIQISWFNDGNLVVYDGDIIYGTIDEFNQVIINVTYSSTSENVNAPVTRRRSRLSARNKRAHSISPLSPALWPGGNIRYRYFDDSNELLHKPDVDAAIAEWVRNVPCLHWVKEPNESSGTTGIVTIQSGSGCSASLGMQSGASLWMTLGSGCAQAEALHEWGHILGLIHEHKRPDAVLFTRFLCSSLDDYPFGRASATAEVECCGAFPSYTCCGHACDFTTEFGSYSIPSPYDLYSVMHYRRSAFAKPGFETLTAGPLSNPIYLSSEDVNRVKELYSCPSF